MDDANKDRAAPDLSGMIEKLLANPDLLSTVATALGKPMPFATPSEERAEEQPTSGDTALVPDLPKEAISTLAPLLSGALGGASGKGLPPVKKDDPRACLLLALKPYLSAERCQTIDEILRLTTLTELLRGFSTPLKGGH